MLGLIIRILVLCSVVFAVVYAITRALRTRVRDRDVARIQQEIRDLRAAVEHGRIDPEEYAVRADRVRRACEDVGVDVPDLPPRLLPRDSKDS